VNNAAFGNDPVKQLLNIPTIGSFFDTSLFSILKSATGNCCVSKCFVTGVFPAFQEEMSPIETILGRTKFHEACGLSDSQVKKLASSYLARFESGAQ
jgi:hypothetical protein